MYTRLINDNKDEEDLFTYFLEEYEEGFSGWDFSYIKNRMVSYPREWSYDSLVRSYLPGKKIVLDMGTGGGEFLSQLPLPSQVYATESYEPNIPIAKQALEHLGVEIIEIDDHEYIPIPDNKFDLIINRHEYYVSSEVARLLKNDGLFITQQVGTQNNLEINNMLNAPRPKTYDPYWTADQLAAELEEVDLHVITKKSEMYKTRIYDVGALLYYLKAIPWQIPDFHPDDYYQPLLEIHHQILQNGYIESTSQRYLIMAEN